MIPRAEMSLGTRTVFLDRDGVINQLRADYVKGWDEFKLVPGAVECIARLSGQGLDVVVMTNQSAIDRGLVSRETVDDIHQRLAGLVAAAGGSIRAFLVCPHTPEAGCDCRKPAPGLFFQARDKLGVDLTRAIMVGDRLSDVQAARAAGCAAVLIDPYGRRFKAARALGATVTPSFRAAVTMLTERAAVTEAIVLCGGLGTRLGRVLGDRPKAMAMFSGRPFIEWLVLALARRGLHRVVFAAGHQADVIRRQFKEGTRFGVELTFSIEAEPFGTGGSARLAATLTRTSPLLLMNGDSYCRFDLDRMWRRHLAQAAAATLWLQRVNRADRFGSVTADSTGQVTHFLEKVHSAGLVSTGVYLVNRNVLDSIPAGRPVSIEHEVWPRLIGRGLFSVTGKGPFVDIGTPEALVEAERVMKRETERWEKVSGRPPE